MDLAAFSPRKLQLSNQCSPITSARKRILFPSNSPQSNDLGLISELYSDDSDVYSPPPLSPSSSITPEKDIASPPKITLDKVYQVANHLEFGISSPQRKSKRSPKTSSLGKENINGNVMTVRKSPRKSFRSQFLEKENFDDHFITLLSESPENKEVPVQFEIKSCDSLITPKRPITVIEDKSDQQNPHSDSYHEVLIKPNSFYGNIAPILATNQTNRIQGMKCVFRPPQPSKAKAKLMFEEKPARKRERSKSMDSVREAKKRKAIFTGVHHAIPKPVKYSPPPVSAKRETVREKARKHTDLSRTPYGSKNKKLDGWEYTLRFTKPLRYEESPVLGEKRKFFKTSVRDSLSSSPGSSSGTSTPVVVKKRKLLDTRQNYLDGKSPVKPQIQSSDILELIEDNDDDKLQDKPIVDDILLRLEEDDEEEKKKDAERQMLMNILEDSPNKAAVIDSLSNCTASLDLNDSFSGSGCSRFSLEDTKENQTTPRRMFSIFNNSAKKALADVTNQGSSSKKKWHGVGNGQLQIDAGQKKFGACQCPDCGMVYQVGEAEDEIQHSSFHNNLSTLRHAGWKNENVVGCFGLDYSIVITGNDPKNWQQKALDVIALVDKSLGITSDISNVMHNQKVFLYVSDKRIVGCMVASPVSRAYKMISSESDVDICSEESFPVRCGISRMWTLFSHRRRAVATCLLDSIRRNFMYGCILSTDDIAFSIPTPDGKQFATKYMQSPNFLVYTGY